MSPISDPFFYALAIPALAYGLTAIWLVPSYVKITSRNMALVLEALQLAERDTPDYVEVDPKAMTARFIRAPELAEVPYPVKMEPNLVVEFYAS